MITERTPRRGALPKSKILLNELMDMGLVPPPNLKLRAQILGLIKAGRPFPQAKLVPMLLAVQSKWFGEHVRLPNIPPDEFNPRKHLGFVEFVMPAPRNKQRTLSSNPNDYLLASVITPRRRQFVHVADLIPAES